MLYIFCDTELVSPGIGTLRNAISCVVVVVVVVVVVSFINFTCPEELECCFCSYNGIPLCVAVFAA